MDELLDKIKEIKEPSQEAKDYKYEAEKGMKLTFDKIIFICDNIPDRPSGKRTLTSHKGDYPK